MTHIDMEQLSLEPVEPPKPTLVAFGRFVKPEMYDVFGEYSFAGLTKDQIDWMKPRNIQVNLFNRDRDNPCVVDGVALNGYEYQLIARSPKKLAETAFSRTLASDDVTEEKLAAAERSGLHILEAKQVAMTSHILKLQSSQVDIQKLAWHARQPGYAHTTEADMKSLLNVAWTEFKTMLDVVHIQRKWTDEQRHQAETALIHYLTQGAQNQRVKHWNVMLSLTNAYLGKRIQLFQGRVDSIGEMLDTDDSWEPQEA